MIRLMQTSLAIVAGLTMAAPALAQPYGGPAVVSSQPMPDTSRESRGIPSEEAVNPAPGAQGPYVGAGPRGFYDVDARINAMTQAAHELPPAQRRRAMVQIHQIRAEEATQRARHGDLRDWDRENLNHRLDMMMQQFPSLHADLGQGPAPAQ